MIIAIHGVAGSGKSTLAQMFAMQLAHTNILPITFNIKKTATESFGWDGQKDGRGRQLLQDIGRIGRKYNENVWLDSWRSNVLECLHLVVDDIRLASEIKYINEHYPHNNIAIKITGRSMYDKDNPLAQDATEVDLDDYLFTHVINNSGSKEDLFRLMMEVIKDERITPSIEISRESEH